MIIDWISTFGPRLLSCASQVAIFAIIVSLLCIRTWTPQGPNIPLMGLLAILVLTLGKFVALPGWTNNSLDWVERKVLEGKTLDSTLQSRPEGKRFTANAGKNFGSNQQQISLETLSTEGWRSWLPKGIAPATETIPIATSGPKQVGSPNNSFSWIWWAYSIPILAIPIGLFRLIAGAVSVRKFKRNSTVIDDPRLSQLLVELPDHSKQGILFETRTSPSVLSPATTGIIKQVLWLPMDWSEWTDLELRGILAHEVTHIRNRDHLAQLAAQTCLAFHFYNPIIHWLVNRLRLEQEWAADHWAAESLGGSKNYLSLLAELALKQESRPKCFTGWPATQFLGGRTLLRRVKMLKSTNVSSRSNYRAIPYVACVLIILLLFGLLGLRPADSIAAPVVKSIESSETAATDGEPKKEFELRYVGDQGSFLIALRPKDLLKNHLLREAFHAFESLPIVQSLTTQLGIEIQTVEQIVIEGTIAKSELKWISFFAQSSSSFESFEKIAISPNGKSSKLGETTFYEMPRGFLAWFPTRNSFVIREKGVGNRIENLIEGQQIPSAITQSDVWKRLSQGDALFVANKKQSTLLMLALRPQVARGNGMLAMIATIMQEADFWGIGTSASTDELVLNLRVLSSDEANSQIAKESLEATTTLAKIFVREFQRVTKSDAGSSQMLGAASAPSRDLQNVIANDPSVNDTVRQAGEIVLTSLQSAKIGKEANTIFAETTIRCDGVLAKRLPSLLVASREAASRSNSSNNLKQIALGFYNYEGSFQKFPHSKLTATNSVYPYSWRVAILPYIEQQELYDLYRFDEPWDSENNKKLLAKMPSLFRHPSQPLDSTTTDYVVLVGEATIFQPNKPSKISDISDGTSATLLVVEAKSNIPWTKPEDIAFDPTGPLPKLGGFTDAGFNAARADGSVLFVEKSIDEAALRAMITPSGGERIQRK
ncbi:Regulatory protein BlaR1 [Pirellula sp. SH-Sr6A]|uniref:M56 family metallopeptidase n=1 Tax=Pirellula sp. SH-Sr6A TaxID=1632865 RepID=UPI00078CD150|nr:M56 family metallopeptidase [Pirellula sp. SH-Sr6A]AMV32963.1 Regulatory protein BlaR1 [Pirellula sp. SH-Sr6A]